MIILILQIQDWRFVSLNVGETLQSNFHLPAFLN